MTRTPKDQKQPDDADVTAALSKARRPAPSAEDEAYDIRIAADGTWFYHGTPINRHALVKLFATVLKRDEAGEYWLITPAEKGRITVDDAPFVAVELAAEGQGRTATLSLRTNLDQWVTVDGEHPITVAYQDGEPRPYMTVRDNLPALIARSVFYDLVERAEEHQGRTGVWSAGHFFPLDEPGDAPGTR